MAVNLSPIGNDSPFYANGVPASGYKLFTYLTGTTTKQPTFTSSSGLVANANPVLLNSQGYPASGASIVEIFLTAGVTYKLVLAPSTDTDPPANPVWTRDGIVGINDVSSNALEWIAGSTPTYLSTVSFSVTGDQTATYHSGRRVKLVVTGGTKYAEIYNSAFSTVTTVVLNIDSGGVLDAGLTSVAYGLISFANSSINVIPTGVVWQYAGATAPPGWGLCYGQAISRTTFSALYALLGTTYGVGDGSTTFNIPDYRGRVAVGKDNMGGVAANRVTTASCSFDAATLGAVGGSQLAQAHSHGGVSGGQSATHVHSGTTGNVSAGHTHILSAVDGNTHVWTGVASAGVGGGYAEGDTGSTDKGAATTGGQSVDHTHAFTSGNASADHTHTIAADNAGSSQNVQPGIAQNYIIKF